METIEKTIEIDAPVNKVYNQWTQFEEFPRFMEGVEQVTQLDDTRLHWVATVAGRRKEWDARITEQVPDMRIAWTSESGAQRGCGHVPQARAQSHAHHAADRVRSRGSRGDRRRQARLHDPPHR